MRVSLINGSTVFDSIYGSSLFHGPGFAIWGAVDEFCAMTLDQANKLIASIQEQMNARYGKVVFDEWAIISLAGNKGRLLTYNGPRKEGFQKNFLADAGSLRAGLLSNEHAAGDFDFSRHAVGTGFEAYMVLGNGLYLICNNTVQSMDGITKDPQWINAQVPFAELSDQIRADPLEAVS